MISLKSLTFACCLSLAACSGAPAEDAEQLEADLSAPLVLGTKEGATSTKKIAVSGAKRMDVPRTSTWSCGESTYYSGTSSSNVAWVEIANPSNQTASVSVAVTGAGYADLYAYASASPSSLVQCTTFSASGDLSGTRSLVVEAGKSAFVLVATGVSTGTYTVSAKVDAFVPSPTPAGTKLLLPTTSGATASTGVTVSGTARLDVPRTSTWSCGESTYYSGTTSSNFAWVEIANPSSQTASVSVGVAGAGYADLYAYASASPSSLVQCTTFSASGELTGTRSLVVEAGKSAFVLVATGVATGSYTVSAKVDAYVPAPTATGTKLVLPSGTGVSVSTGVTVSGTSRLDVPRTSTWSCGESTYYSGTTSSNFAWVEVANPSNQTASVSVEVEGAGYADLYAYLSAAPSSLVECTTFSASGALTGTRSLVVEAGKSAFLLVATGVATGSYDVLATVDAFVDP